MRDLETTWGKRVPYLLSAVVLFGVVVMLLLRMSTVYAATYTVTNTNDSGAGSFRQAILDANANVGADTISFNIAGSGVHTLTPASAYDVITESVTIDGYSQTGSAVNTAVAPAALNGVLTIEIDFSGSPFTDALEISASDVTIKGLVINHASTAIRITSGSNVLVAGNYIGTDVTGSSDQNNAGAGVLAAPGTGEIYIGSTASADRNIISGNSESGIQSRAENITILGNFIGIDASGSAALGNGSRGILINEDSLTAIIGSSAIGGTNVISSNASGIVCVGGGPVCIIKGNYIGSDASGTLPLGNVNFGVQGNSGGNIILGGTSPGEGNLISAQSSYGFVVFGVGNTIVIQGNKIGTDINGDIASGMGNGKFGIYNVADSSATLLVGGTTSGAGNIIAGNGEAGIMNAGLVPASLAPTRSTFLGNNIFGNGGLGIDLAADSSFSFIPDIDVGVNPNDVGDPDPGANNYLNFPVFNSMVVDGSNLTANFDLDINDAELAPNGYRIEFYKNTAADPSGHGQGEIFLGSTTVAGDVTGQSFTFTPASAVSAGDNISATATEIYSSDTNGFRGTSEFSADIVATTSGGGGDSGGSGAGANSDSGSTNGSLADSGENMEPLLAVAGLLLIVGSAGGVYVARRKVTS